MTGIVWAASWQNQQNNYIDSTRYTEILSSCLQLGFIVVIDWNEFL